MTNPLRFVYVGSEQYQYQNQGYPLGWRLINK